MPLLSGGYGWTLNAACLDGHPYKGRKSTKPSAGLTSLAYANRGVTVIELKVTHIILALGHSLTGPSPISTSADKQNLPGFTAYDLGDYSHFRH